jgi:hypothetical protein
VDPGSSASRPIAAPSGALDQLPTAPERFRALLGARALTEARLADLRGKVEDISLPSGTSLVLFGSWGRAELTDESDVDWALIVDDPDLAVNGPAVSQAVEQLRTLLEGEGKPPGGQQVFGCAFHGWRLVDHIGLADDDSANITRRLLLLLESIAVTSPDVHDGLKRRVLERYLTGHKRSHRPPRFLLNDVVRYWRTIGVDFEGKVAQDLREGRGEGKFVMRNAKLRTSRKMLYVSGLLPVLLCHYVASEDMLGFLGEQFGALATDRVARAFLHLGFAEAGARTLGAYSDWIDLLSDPANRTRLEELSQETRHEDQVFRAVRHAGSQLDNGLLALLYESDLGPIAQRFVTI